MREKKFCDEYFPHFQNLWHTSRRFHLGWDKRWWGNTKQWWLWSTQAKSKRIAVFWSWCGDVSEVSSAVWDDLLFWKPASLFPPDVLFPPPLASKVCSSTYISWDKQSPTQCSSLQCERLPCAFKGWNQWNSPLNTTKHCFKWQGVILQTPIQPFCHIETLIEWKRC